MAFSWLIKYGVALTTYKSWEAILQVQELQLRLFCFSDTTQLYGDYFINHYYPDPIIQQPGIQGKYPAGFFGPWLNPWHLRTPEASPGLASRSLCDLGDPISSMRAPFARVFFKETPEKHGLL